MASIFFYLFLSVILQQFIESSPFYFIFNFNLFICLWIYSSSKYIETPFHFWILFYYLFCNTFHFFLILVYFHIFGGLQSSASLQYLAILFLSALSFVISSSHLIFNSPILSCYISTPYLYALSHPPPLFSTSYFYLFFLSILF